MGYIDEELGIKSAKSLEKYLSKELDRDLIVLKTPEYLRVIWAINSKLFTYDIKAHVIYCVKVEEIEEAINIIRKRINDEKCKF
jgi:hypothetical protein